MRFELKAVSPEGRVESLALHGLDQASAVQQAESRGYTVLGVRARAGFGVSWRGGQARFPLVLFSQELLVLLKAGLPLVESIETLGERERRGEFRALLASVASILREGNSLSSALQPDLRGAQRRSPDLLEAPALVGPAGGGPRGSGDGHPCRPRDRGGVRAAERSCQGPDRERAVEAACDRRAPEAVPACAFLPHHRDAPQGRHAAPDRAPDGREVAAPAVARAAGDGEPGGQ